MDLWRFLLIRLIAMLGRMLEPASVDSSGSRPAQVVPDYELLRPIGRGHFSTVYLARNRHDGSHRAIKLICRGSDIERQGLRRYQAYFHEHHHHLVPILHVGRTVDGRLYCSMPLANSILGEQDCFNVEFYEPLTLQAFINQRQCDVDMALRIGDHISRGLETFHRGGAAHGDVNPQNILRMGRMWRLCDTSLVGRPGPAQGGTPGYLPPEGTISQRGDVFALGMTMFVVLTGRTPDSFKAFEQGRLDIPGRDQRRRSLRQLILNACAANPADRPSSASEMRARLEVIRRGARLHGVS